MKKLFLTCVFIAITFIASATTYYISPTGNDTTGNGSIGNPWRMLSKATSVVTAVGDIIHVNSGVYQDNNYCDLAVGVSIEGDGKAITIIKTTYAYSSPISYSYGYIRAYSSSANANGNQHITGITFNGLNISYRAIIVYFRKNVTISDCHFEKFKGSAVLFYNTYYTNITEPTPYVTGNSYHDNTSKDCSGQGNGSAVMFLGQENFTCYNNTILEQRRSDSCYAGINGYSSRNFKIYNNIIKKATRYSDFWAFALEIRFSHGNAEIYNNTVEGVLDVTYNLKHSQAYGLWIHDNILGSDVSGEHQYGITLEADNIGVRIERNKFKNVEYGLSITTNVITSSQVDSIAVIGNAFYNIGYPDTRFRGGGIKFSGSATYPAVPQYRRIMIYNNTIKGNGYAVAGFWLASKGNYDDIKFKNNIITNFDLSTSYGGVYIDKSTTQTMTVDSLAMDHNIIYQTGNSNNVKVNNLTLSNFTETSTLKVDPLFISTRDFALQTESPARNTGLNVGLVSDITGRIIPQETIPDIGAYEYILETPAVLSTVILDLPYNITSHTLAIFATVVLDGSGTITERGIVWNTSAIPTTANHKQVKGSGLGKYYNLIEGLLPETNYYIRAYSVNEVGTSYSNQVIITTSDKSAIQNNGKLVRDKDNTIIY